MVEKENNTYTFSFRFIMENYNWDRFCELKGYNPWFINEGLGSKDETTILSKEQCVILGIIQE